MMNDAYDDAWVLKYREGLSVSDQALFDRENPGLAEKLALNTGAQTALGGKAVSQHVKTSESRPRGHPEDDLITAIIEAAHLHGWLCYHQRPAWTGKGYRTALAGDAGFLDLVLVHGGRGVVILAECKSDTGKLSAEQERWCAALEGCYDVPTPGRRLPYSVYYQIWRPGDWQKIERILRVE